RPRDPHHLASFPTRKNFPPQALLSVFPDHSSIFRTLFSCLPPSNSVFNQMSTMSDASPFPMTLSPIARMFESLCSLVALAENVSCTKAHLIPLTLFAEILMPIPVPQIRMPLSY